MAQACQTSGQCWLIVSRLCNEGILVIVITVVESIIGVCVRKAYCLRTLEPGRPGSNPSLPHSNPGWSSSHPELFPHLESRIADAEDDKRTQ